MNDYILWLDTLNLADLNRVGGKNASLGEMISHLSDAGVSVPGGFATTSVAFQDFLTQTGLANKINQCLDTLNVDDLDALVASGKKIRQWIIETPLQTTLTDAVSAAYVQMQEKYGSDLAVAVRSSATAEDLPDASFAGQQETYLNVSGLTAVLHKIHEVFASLYNDRAISYRVHQGFDHSQVSLSAGIQLMVRSDIASSGVMFTLDTESGFRDVVFITSSYGLGETVVQGSVDPDEFYVSKIALAAGKRAILRKNVGGKAIKMVYCDDPKSLELVKIVDVDSQQQERFSLNDTDIEILAQQACVIEKHYQRPMDIEWAKDGKDGKIYIVQARPETVKSRDNDQIIERYRLKQTGKLLVEGRSVGHRIGAGTAKIVKSIESMSDVLAGDVLVTEMTDPDWEPIMKRASAIITNRGGRTCHAAIIARELGIPAVVGCGNATTQITHGQAVTVSCAEGDTGFVYDTKLEFEINQENIGSLPKAPIKIMMNVGNPDKAFSFSAIPNHGVGLARLEFIINQMIGIHPKALLEFDQLEDPALKLKIGKRIAAYADPISYYIDRLAEGIATIAASFAHSPVIVRLSDFKSNEYANLIGGELYEPDEENPMLGFRGASRYISDSFKACFKLECEALKRVRNEMGLTNVWAMIPFVRTLEEAEQVIELMKANGLERGKDGLKIIMMCELPSNALLADQFLDHFDGFSIGSNDLTQLCLGLDRDSEIIAHLFDERNPAVKRLLEMAIHACRKRNKYIGICGQGPSDHPDLAQWLMEQGIESMSLNPDTVVETWQKLAKHSNKTQ